jgi:hypothetical protein
MSWKYIRNHLWPCLNLSSINNILSKTFYKYHKFSHSLAKKKIITEIFFICFVHPSQNVPHCRRYSKDNNIYIEYKLSKSLCAPDDYNTESYN